MESPLAVDPVFTIQKSIPRELLDEDLGVLVDKVAHDRFPSAPCCAGSST